MNLQQHNPPHPGQFINEVYIIPHGLVSNQVAKKLGVNASTFNRLLNQKSDVTPEMAIKLSVVFGRSPESWLMMQANHNLWKARQVVEMDLLVPIKFAV